MCVCVCVFVGYCCTSPECLTSLTKHWQGGFVCTSQVLTTVYTHHIHTHTSPHTLLMVSAVFD